MRTATSNAAPDFVIAGTGRSGTTALFEALRAHPDVFLTTPKETHFLAYEGVAGFHGPGDPESINRVMVRTKPEYLSLFDKADAHQVRGDGSISTLYNYERSVPRLQALNPDAKIVIVLREPAARAYSAYRYLVARGFEPADFDTALREEDQRIAAGWQHLYHYRSMSQYSESVAAFLEAFGRERVGIWFYDDINRDAPSVVREVFTHIGVDPARWRDSEMREINVSGVPRSQLAQRGIQQLSRHPGIRTAVKRIVPYYAREWVRRTNLRPEDVPSQAAISLREDLAGDSAALERVLGRPVPWVTRSVKP